VCANNMCYDPQNSCSPIVPMCKISVQQQQALMSRLNPSCPVPPNAQLPSLMSTPQPNTSLGSMGLVMPLPALSPPASPSFGQSVIAGLAAFGPEMAFGGLVGANLYLSAKYPSETSTCYMSFQPMSAPWYQNLNCGYLATVLSYSPAQSQVQTQAEAGTSTTEPDIIYREGKNKAKTLRLYRQKDWESGLSFSIIQPSEYIKFSAAKLSANGYVVRYDKLNSIVYNVFTGNPVIGSDGQPETFDKIGHVTVYHQNKAYWDDWYTQEQQYTGTPNFSQQTQSLYDLREP